MKKIFLLLFLVTNFIASFEIKKEEYLKSFKYLKPEVKNLVDKLVNYDDFLEQFLNLLKSCGEACVEAWCNQLGVGEFVCQSLMISIRIYRDPF